MSNGFTPEQIAWLREHAPGTYFAPLTEEFNRVFNQSRSQAAIVSACFYRTQFKKGQQAANYLPVGSIRYTPKSGCMIKVQDNGPYNARWKSAGRFLWNKHHPEDPVQKNDRIIYADGNPQNLDRDNLLKLSGAEYITYTHLRGALIEKGNVDPDALRAVITLAKIRSRLGAG